MDVEQEEWLVHALKEYERKRCIAKVLSTDQSEACPKGDNYASDMYRLKLKVVTNAGEVEDRQFIYKAMPSSQHRRYGLKKSGLFATETRMYLETLPEMERILKEKEVGAEIFWPICYGVKRGNEGYLLQDLSTLGFQLRDRMIGMDYEHSSLALQTLGKFHALGAVGIEIAEILPSDYNVYTFTKSKEIVILILGKSYFELAEAIEKWGNEWLDYAESVKKFGEKYPEAVVECFKRDEKKFNTLNHGDCWINNIMFRHDSTGKPESIRFVDYQLAHVNGPGFDLQYFFNTSLHYSLFERKHELIRVYHDSLVKNLKLFGYRAALPTLDDVLDSYKKASVFGLGVGLTFRPLMMIPSKDAPDMEDLAKSYATGESKGLSKYFYDGEFFLNTLRATLVDARKDGLL